MTTRVTTKTGVFSRPFVLNEADGEQQPGIYTVETEEEPLDVITIAAALRTKSPRLSVRLDTLWEPLTMTRATPDLS